MEYLSLIYCVCLVLINAELDIGNGLRSRPNILFIVVDDLRPALGCYGDDKAYTPNIDRLARRSLVFQNVYAQQALCAPSRNSLLTGRRPDTLKLYDFYSYWRQDVENFTTLPQHLKNHGYTTMSFGKVFHPGISSNFTDDYPYSWTAPAFHPYTERFKDSPVCLEFPENTPANNLVCPVNVPTMPNGTLPDIEITHVVEKFLINRKESNPLFLAVGFYKPHIPFKFPKQYLEHHPLEKFQVPKNYEWNKKLSSVAYNPWTDLRERKDVEKLNLTFPWQKIPRTFAEKIIQSYYASVSYIDASIGKLLNYIYSTKYNTNTVIILTSDHGWSLGEHAEWAKYSNFDIALKVPLLISIPQEVVQKQNHLHFGLDDSIIELLDLFPTIAELTGHPIEKCPGKKCDSNKNTPMLCSEGSSFANLLIGRASYQKIPWNNRAISQYPRPGIQPTLRPNSDKPRLKSIKIMGYSIRTVKFRYTIWVRFSTILQKPYWEKIVAEELYRHDIDPNENENIANYKQYKETKENLKSILINII